MTTKSHLACCVGLLVACLSLVSFYDLSASPVQAGSLPRVTLNAESIGPRHIEQKTGETVTRDYAQAWQDLADSLESNRTGLLNDHFTGGAKELLSQRISEQRKNGVRTHYVDHGHQVKAVFYSADGGEMQLQDRAQIEVQVFDGQKMIYTASITSKYLVLMTPGADRWYVRSLETVPEDAF